MATSTLPRSAPERTAPPRGERLASALLPMLPWLVLVLVGAALLAVGALAISGPVSRLTTARAEQVKDALVEAAGKLTAACGGTPSSSAAKRPRKRKTAII